MNWEEMLMMERIEECPGEMDVARLPEEVLPAALERVEALLARLQEQEVSCPATDEGSEEAVSWLNRMDILTDLKEEIEERLSLF